MNKVINIFPFTVKQLMHFDEEIREAGGFELLMRRKEAILVLGNTQHICHYKPEEYKRKYLTGIYEPLQAYFTTPQPYTFWSRMYEQLERAKEMLC